MKRLHFRYEMRLQMSQDVTDHHFLLRLRPMEDGQQACEAFEYRIEPADTVDEVWDGFGNRGYSGAVRRLHRLFSAVSEGIVTVDRGIPVREGLHPMYRFPSRYTEPEADVVALYQELCKELPVDSTDKTAFVAVTMERLYRCFSYAPGITTVHTTAAEALRGGSGVCQDYAHILISLCRLAGIPARYVAGMMMGEGATHAWVEVWLDGHWQGLDPTHDRPVDESYIKLTHGRDFGDGTVDKGCFIGFAAQQQQIHIKVEEVE